MASGYQQHMQRMEALEALGRNLVRRAHARCELCGSSHCQLTAIEVPPLPETPDIDHAIFLCELCRDAMAGKSLQPDYWHFLESVVWSDIPPVQMTAVRLCKRLEAQGVSWAAEILATLYLTPEVAKELDD